MRFGPVTVPREIVPFLLLMLGTFAAGFMLMSMGHEAGLWIIAANAGLVVLLVGNLLVGKLLRRRADSQGGETEAAAADEDR
ncbi:hypothetical protein [Streptomonospora litoralis]|uniref:Uncharacterized protein n=1 Tax=Streptomonospora litoralis TaxID=2498135 RepID=A0A4P6Q8D4_9ACTN|nr:hypothetical protein [Streptomonospora litoralis]QBI56700.1 hypothetical protein EKD16_24790 [Streptomonospora litoralis]